jgi:hypothetical protein
MGHQEASGATVLRFERLAVELMRDPRLAVGDVREGKVRRVSAVTPRNFECAVGIGALTERVDRDGRVELRPLGDAVDVAGEGVGRSRLELGPRPRAARLDGAADREAPLVSRRLRRSRYAKESPGGGRWVDRRRA